MLAGALVGGAGPAAWRDLPPTPALPRPDQAGHLDAAGGARLFHASYGAGEPVLLLHGGMANSAYWGHLIPRLSAERRVLVMDSRGHGRSTLGQAGLSYALLAADALAVLDAAGADRAAVVGWSDGGIAGLHMALAAPRRIGRLFAFGANDSRGGGRADAAASPAVRLYRQRCAAEYRALSPSPAGFDGLMQALGGLWRTGPGLLPPQLSGIRVPTTIAGAEDDEFIHPARTRDLAAAIPGARLHILQHVTHFAMLQDPAQFGLAVTESLR